MRRIERTTVFSRDFKREKKGQHRRDIDSLILNVVPFWSKICRCLRNAGTMDLVAIGATIANAT